MGLLKVKNELPQDANLEDLQDALSELGFKKVNNIMKSLGLSHKGRKSKDIVRLSAAISQNEITLAKAVNAFNVEIKIINARRSKVQEVFNKENVQDTFEDVWEWLQFAWSIWKNK